MKKTPSGDLTKFAQVGTGSTTTTSSSVTRVGTGTPTGFPASCPTDNLKNITDTHGVSYQVRCASDVGAVGGGTEVGTTATSSFNDCFLLCDTTPMTGGAGRCTGFTYVGAVNGTGGGTCYLKSGTSYTVGTAANNYIGGLRLADAVSVSPSPGALATTTTTTTTTPAIPTTTTTTTTSFAFPTITTTTISTTTTTTTSSSATASTAINTYSCPANDNSVVTDSGTQYQMRCGFQAQPVAGAGSYQTQTGQSSLNVCLRACTTNSVEDRNNPGTFPICAGFTFVVTNTGDGSGNCVHRLQTPLTFGSPSAAFTGLIKVQYYQAPAVTTTTTSTTTTSPELTVTFTTVSYATITTTSSYPVTATAISTQVETVTTSYPVTQTQISTAPGTSSN